MNLRVLLAVADAALLSTYRRYLGDQKIEARTCSSGLECLEQMRYWVPAVVVLDAELPWGSGLGVLALMRENPILSAIPVLLLVTRKPPRAHEGSFRDHLLLLKPVPPDVLVDTIHTLAASASDNCILLSQSGL